MRQVYALATLAVLGCSAGLVSAALAQDPAFDLGVFDCIVEPKSTIKLGSREQGILSDVLVSRGSVVKRGQVIAKLDSELQRIQVDIATLRAENDLEIAASDQKLKFKDSELKRANELYAKTVIAERRMEEVSSERRLAEVELESARFQNKVAKVELDQAKQRLEQRFIRSPVDGVVHELKMEAGEYAYEQSVIATLVVLDPLLVEVFVPQSYFGRIWIGQPALVQTEVPAGVSRQAHVVVVDRVFDAASGTFGVRLEMPNPELDLPAGVRCRIRFMQYSTPSALDARQQSTER
jgi:RND family efflux transporter MFP subunit